MQLKDLTNLFLAYEKDTKLFDLKFKKYPVWVYYRMYFFYTFTEDKKLYNNPSSPIKFSFQYIWKILGVFNVFKLLKQSDYFILEHSRSNKDKVDIYTNEYIETVSRENCSVFSFSLQGNVNKKDDVIILDFIKIVSKLTSKVLFKLINGDFYKKNFLYFLELLEVDNKDKYVKNFKRYYLELIIQYYFYYFLLKLKKTKKVVLTVSYLNMPLVFAAKNLNIEVVEFQHGVISNYHLGYNYPYYKGDFFPDTLYTFGDFWNTSASFPKECNVKTSGNDYMCLDKTHINKEKNTILIVSQGTIGKKLSKYILANQSILENFTVYFKLHPSEFNEKNIKYKDILNLKNMYCITTEKSINELQNICEFQIGIYSTAVFEGIEKNCRTLLLDDTGIEYMENLIEKDIVKLIHYDTKLEDVLKETPVVSDILFFENFRKDSVL